MENGIFGAMCLGKHTEEKSTLTTSISATVKSQYLEEGQAKPHE